MIFGLKPNYTNSKYAKKIAENFLSTDLVWRKKVGFTIPLDDWFRHKSSQHLIEL